MADALPLALQLVTLEPVDRCVAAEDGADAPPMPRPCPVHGARPVFGCHDCRSRLIVNDYWRCACGDWRRASDRRWCAVCKRCCPPSMRRASC